MYSIATPVINVRLLKPRLEDDQDWLSYRNNGTAKWSQSSAQ